MAEVIYPVILAGGASSRLWPASGPDSPKWALRVPDQEHPNAADALTLLEAAWARARAIAPAENCVVITGQLQAELVRRALPHLPTENLLVEPQPRDTAGAVACAAGLILGRDPEALMLVLPGDQVITPVARFVQCVQAAAEAARRHAALVTFGILPRWAASGYGYVQRGAVLSPEIRQPDGSVTPAVYQIQDFREKPDQATAEQYLASGEYFWNGGIFLWQVKVLLAELERLLPAHAAFARAFALAGPKADVLQQFLALPRISIDFGLMEKARAVITVASDFHWDDIGSWSALGTHLQQEQGNAVEADTRLTSLDSAGNVVYAPGKRVALIGVEGLAVVQAGDEILVCKLTRDQDVKKVSLELNK